MPYADLTDVRCHYELRGSGDPLLLIPGLGTTKEIWSDATVELAKSFSLILIDNRGIGRSESKRPAKVLADYAGDVVELLDHLGLEKSHVMGISLGGIIAQRLAIEHPSRVDRLVLISCTNRFGPYLREVAGLLGQALRYFPQAVFRRTVELLGTSPEYIDAHPAEIDRRVMLAAQSRIQRAAIIQQLRCLDCDEVAPPGGYRIVSPTLVVAGEQDVLIPPSYAKTMAREITGSGFVVIPGCGHNPIIEKPAVIVPLVRKFLQGESAAPVDLSLEATRAALLMQQAI